MSMKYLSKSSVTNLSYDIVGCAITVHIAQLMTYMKLLKKPQGLLFNFYSDNITKSVKPLINEYFERLAI